jgi:nucleoside-diphosphate-sugar epimerase
MDSLISGGAKLFCVDNFDSFYDPNIKFTNAKGMAKKFPDLFELVTGDIQNPDHLKGIFQKTKFDFVVYLAARAGVRPSIAEPLPAKM